MDQKQKDELFTDAQSHVEGTVKSIVREIPVIEKELDRVQQEVLAARRQEDRLVRKEIHKIYTQKSADFKNAADSPYFSRCDIAHDDGKSKTLYFGKFSIPEFNIYSWVSPASQIRFGAPGPFSYESNNEKYISGTMSRNDQYLIAQGKITFMATTTLDHPRTLVYQEHFSNRKSAFVLPEIVERMERAQDTIIRADHRGSFLISGPAGSGKTTLALHRIAYLLQSPEFANRFKAEDILVLVQDDSTKQYFDELLPSLGIKDVAITTFAAWALERLDLADINFVNRYGTNEMERDSYEFAKNRAMKAMPEGAPMGGRHFSWLQTIYDTYLTPELQRLFEKQRKEKVLDRFDLTALLLAQIGKNGLLTKEEKVYDEYHIGKARFQWTTKPIRYSLILLDEVQNYLPEQIGIVKSCIAPETKAMTYVGDLAQQTSLFTLRDWKTIGENFNGDRMVKLEKVYRSTRQILEYIRSVGYDIEIPNGVREGKPVEIVASHAVSEVIAKNSKVLVGILGMAPEDVEPYMHFVSKNVRVMTINKAQGVEFDIVILVSKPRELSNYPESMVAEKKKIIKDQWYVGLTRAMNELYVVEE